MTALALQPAYIAINPLRQKVFAASGGTAPYTFKVLPGGIGGFVDPLLGTYIPPVGVNGVSPNGSDTIQVTDSSAPPLVATSKVMVGTPLHLIVDILTKEMAIPQGRAWVYDQKVLEPTDLPFFVVVGILTDKILGAGVRYVDDGMGGLNEVKTTNIVATLTIDIKSRDTSARDRRGELITALQSTYARAQQNANGFKVGQLPFAGPQDLSHIDGAAIPYWFQLQVRVHFLITKTAPVGVYTNFQPATVLTNP